MQTDRGRTPPLVACTKQEKGRANMAKIIYNGVEEITPETAMNWFAWYELVKAMERERDVLDESIKAVDRNVPDWEKRVLLKFLELAERDLLV